jgi:hypothetical protein
MKTWQIFAIGVVALLLLFFLPAYEPMIAGLGATTIVAVVIAGFLARPRREVFYVRTTNYVNEIDDLALEHDLVAIRIEVVRLWLLFVPTVLAVGFLFTTAANGTIWKFKLLDRDPGQNAYLLGRVLLLVVWGVLSTWVSERWVLRNAEVCSANSVSVSTERVLYSFVNKAGEYYGGEAFPFGLVRPAQLATLVLYDAQKPGINKIAMGCLFHRPVIIGRGLAELDEATVAAQISPAEAES